MISPLRVTLSTNIIDFDNSIETLTISDCHELNNITHIPNSSLKELGIHFTCIDKLVVPKSVKILKLECNNFSRLDNISIHGDVEYLSISGIKILSNLPKKIKRLLFGTNALQKIEDIPESIEEIKFYGTLPKDNVLALIPKQLKEQLHHNKVNVIFS